MDIISDIPHSRRSVLDKVLLNLSILAKIQRGDKLIIRGDFFEIDTRYLQGLQRFIEGNSRSETIDKLNDILDMSFKLTDEILKAEHLKSSDEGYFIDDNSSKLQTIKSCMENACKGLENLRETYSHDVTIRTNIELLVNKISTRTTKITELLRINSEDQ